MKTPCSKQLTQYLSIQNIIKVASSASVGNKKAYIFGEPLSLTMVLRGLGISEHKELGDLYSTTSGGLGAGHEPSKDSSLYVKPGGALVTMGKENTPIAAAKIGRPQLDEFARRLEKANPVGYDALIEGVNRKAEVATTIAGLVSAAAAGFGVHSMAAPDPVTFASILIGFVYSTHNLDGPINTYLRNRRLRALIRENLDARGMERLNIKL
jgi:hypothetical protein